MMPLILIPSQSIVGVVSITGGSSFRAWGWLTQAMKLAGDQKITIVIKSSGLYNIFREYKKINIRNIDRFLV